MAKKGQLTINLVNLCALQRPKWPSSRNVSQRSREILNLHRCIYWCYRNVHMYPRLHSWTLTFKTSDACLLNQEIFQLVDRNTNDNSSQNSLLMNDYSIIFMWTFLIAEKAPFAPLHVRKGTSMRCYDRDIAMWPLSVRCHSLLLLL